MQFELVVRPRETWTRQDFLDNAVSHAIALDGMVSGGPFYDEDLRLLNCDHHDGVVREATMSTAMQVFFAIKGGCAQAGFRRVYVNDPDQDTTLAVWLLRNSHLFEGIGSNPVISRLLTLNDRLDVTGGAFPMLLDDDVLSMHNWVFQPYTSARTSGALATMSAASMATLIEAIGRRLDDLLMGRGGRAALAGAYELLADHGWWKVIDEQGGNEARYRLYAAGMQAFVSLVATRPDGRFVYSVGRRSRFIPFPVQRILKALSASEPDAPWGGSDLIGGSSRAKGSALTWEQVQDQVRFLLHK